MIEGTLFAHQVYPAIQENMVWLDRCQPNANELLRLIFVWARKS